MFKFFVRKLSDLLWIVGAEDTALQLMLSTYDEPEPLKLPVGPYTFETVFEDKDLIASLNSPYSDAVCLPVTVEDMNL